MGEPATLFQLHHVIEQQMADNSALLKKLWDLGACERDGARNLLGLPTDKALAAELGVSPHWGGPVGDYKNELVGQLKEMESTVSGRAVMATPYTREQVQEILEVVRQGRGHTLTGDAKALMDTVGKVNHLTDTMKAGLVNGDLVTNAAQEALRGTTNAKVRDFFGDIDNYANRHASQIRALGEMSPAEAKWAAITKTPERVSAALKAIDASDINVLKIGEGDGRELLGQAVMEAQGGKRLPASMKLSAAFPEVPLLEPEVKPKGGTAGRVLFGLTVAEIALGGLSNGNRSIELLAEGNGAGANAVMTRYVAADVGGPMAGFMAGAAVGWMTGAPTGPGAVVTGIAGGVIATYAGGYYADQRDRERIFTQTDHDGNVWRRDSEKPDSEWTRSTRMEVGAGQFRTIQQGAGPGLVNELDYRSTNASFELGLARPPLVVDPFRIQGEQTEPGWNAKPWTRDADSGRWQRILHEQTFDPQESMAGDIKREWATPAQVAELNSEAQRRIGQNAMNAPAAFAARYELMHAHLQWNRLGPEPAAVYAASEQTQVLRASDDNVYVRGKDGRWLNGDHTATGNLRDELEGTWNGLHAGLAKHAVMLEDARAHPAELPPADLRTRVAAAYEREHLARSPEQIDAATLAVEREHARIGLGQTSFTLDAGKDGSLITRAASGDGDMTIRSITTLAEITRAYEDTHPGMPAPAPVDASPAVPASPPPTVPGVRTLYEYSGPQGMHRDDAVPVPTVAAAAAGALPLNDPSHRSHGMYAALEGVVHARDAAVGRTPDALSTQLAGALTADARARGLDSIGFAQFSPDGSRVFMSDARDPASPQARMAVTDVAQAVNRPLADSSERVAALDREAVQQAPAPSPQLDAQPSRAASPRVA